MPTDNREPKVCPLEGSEERGLPPLRMQPLRNLNYCVWQMELSLEGIFLAPDDQSAIGENAIDLEAEHVADIPLSGLQVKLADRHLLVKRMLRMVKQIVEHEDWERNPLCLVPRDQLIRGERRSESCDR